MEKQNAEASQLKLSVDVQEHLLILKLILLPP